MNLSPMPVYYIQDRNGNPTLGFDDVLEGKAALDEAEPGSSLIRARDGVPLAHKYGLIVPKKVPT